jgi:hypothetical protein
MSTSPQYDEILNRFERLSTADQLQLLEYLVALMRRQIMDHPPRTRHSIMELRGLGKEIWEGIDAQEYVNQERASWNG